MLVFYVLVLIVHLFGNRLSKIQQLEMFPILVNLGFRVYECLYIGTDLVHRYLKLISIELAFTEKISSVNIKYKKK